MAASAKTKERYKTKPKTQEENEQNKTRTAYFEAKLTEKIDESMVNATHPDMLKWAKELTKTTPNGKARYKCFEEITGDRGYVGRLAERA